MVRTPVADRSQVSVSVQSTQPTALEAEEAASRDTAAVLAAVGAVNGISAADITSAGVSLNPQHAYDERSRQSTVTGYCFTQQLQGRSVAAPVLLARCCSAAPLAAPRAHAGRLDLQ